MTAAELAEKLERLDALFVDLYNYAEVERDKIRAGEGNAVHALNSIRHTIGGRYNVIPQAAARLRRMEEALQYVDDCFNAAIIEGWIDAKESGDLEVIRDIWQRRISYAWSNTINVLADGRGE